MKLRALVLLGGSLRPTPLARAIGRSILDLPINERGTLLRHWQSLAAELARTLALDRLPVRLVVDREAPAPSLPPGDGQVAMGWERDASAYRGTGGVLRDLAAEYDDEDRLLVAGAAQVMLRPLGELALEMARRSADACVVAHRDGTPSALMLCRCGSLREISPVGFVDLKEQALPAMARKHSVRALALEAPAGMPVRTLAGYIAALERHHQGSAAGGSAPGPFRERLGPAFAIVEEGGRVEEGAVLHDAVVLRGGVVEAGAVVAESLVCGDGRARGRRALRRQLITAAAGGSWPSRRRVALQASGDVSQEAP